MHSETYSLFKNILSRARYAGVYEYAVVDTGVQGALQAYLPIIGLMHANLGPVMHYLPLSRYMQI